ncbi:hypothetical protein [Arthrobacter sp. 2MCAF14]|uniref:hypothetical protein n=1 Tax=Arthrobacter sp. 2MCAF14 TaxID=3232982 RepID=UPI003F93D8A3
MPAPTVAVPAVENPAVEVPVGGVPAVLLASGDCCPFDASTHPEEASAKEATSTIVIAAR